MIDLCGNLALVSKLHELTSGYRSASHMAEPVPRSGLQRRAQSLARTASPPERLPAAPCEEGWPGVKFGSRRTLAGFDRTVRSQHGCQAIPAAEFSTDNVTIRAERFAQRGNLNFEVLLRHYDAAPYPAH